MSPIGWGGQRVGTIDPERGYCHPAQAKRTKCACGKVCRLWTVFTRCECGRLHGRQPGVSAFARTQVQPVRPGGKHGCPGCDHGDSATTSSRPPAKASVENSEFLGPAEVEE